MEWSILFRLVKSVLKERGVPPLVPARSICVLFELLVRLVVGSSLVLGMAQVLVPLAEQGFL